MPRLSLTFDGPLAKIALHNPSQNRPTQTFFDDLPLFRTEDASVVLPLAVEALKAHPQPFFPFTES